MQKLLVDTGNVNPHFICTLCNGYFRQPYTIRECIHTFCKSCIFKYIVSGVGNQCPICQLEFGTYPLSGTKSKPPQIVQDHMMEGLVKKLFPQLDPHDKEQEEIFYSKLNFKRRDGTTANTVSVAKPVKFKRLKGPNVEMILRPAKSTLRANGIPPRTRDITFFWKLPDKNRISDLKLCLRKALGKKNIVINLDEIEIRCMEKVLGKEHTLQFISRTIWKRSSPIELQYRCVDESKSSIDSFDSVAQGFIECEI